MTRTNHKWGREWADNTHRPDGKTLAWGRTCTRCGADKGGERWQYGGTGNIRTHLFRPEPGGCPGRSE